MTLPRRLRRQWRRRQSSRVWTGFSPKETRAIRLKLQHDALSRENDSQRRRRHLRQQNSRRGLTPRVSPSSSCTITARHSRIRERRPNQGGAITTTLLAQPHPSTSAHAEPSPTSAVPAPQRWSDTTSHATMTPPSRVEPHPRIDELQASQGHKHRRTRGRGRGRPRPGTTSTP